jgi:predicted 2-oxoglutarate/Fe(II)-dependent dioxygenase YbiX
MDLHPHSDRVFSIDPLLTAGECLCLIDDAQRHGFTAAGVRTVAGQRMMQSIRNNERVQFESPVWVERLWLRLSKATLPALDGQVAEALPKELRFYKYSEGQRFKMHKDGSWTEAGLTSKLTLLVYLNDDFLGGETDFRDFKIVPKRGAALLFIHDTWHEGSAVTEGVKYVLRSDVLYGVPGMPNSHPQIPS